MNMLAFKDEAGVQNPAPAFPQWHLSALPRILPACWRTYQGACSIEFCPKHYMPISEEGGIG